METMISIRLPQDLLEEVDKAAAADHRTRAGYIRLALTKMLENHNTKKPAKRKAGAK